MNSEFDMKRFMSLLAQTSRGHNASRNSAVIASMVTELYARKADARVIEQGTYMYSLLVNVRDYLSKLRFEGMDMQLTNECWIELIEKELRKVRG